MKRTVSIVGLLPSQVAQVRKQLRGVCNLRFAESRKGKNLARIPQADHCFLLIKFVGHRWTDLAFKKFPRECVHYHRGGVTELVTAIRRLPNQGE